MIGVIQPLPDGWECTKRKSHHVVWQNDEGCSVMFMSVGASSIEMWQVERMRRTEEGDDVHVAGFPKDRAEAENLALTQIYKF